MPPSWKLKGRWARRVLEIATLLLENTWAYDALAVAQVFDDNPVEACELDCRMRYVSLRGEARLDHGVTVACEALDAYRAHTVPDILIIPGFSHSDVIARGGLDDAGRAAFFLGEDACRADEARAWVRDLHGGGCVIASMCTAAFFLGWCALLDGVLCTTHWRYGEDLARTYPRARVVPDTLRVHDERAGIWSSAGGSACIDLCLSLLLEYLGQAPAREVINALMVGRPRSCLNLLPDRAQPGDPYDFASDSALATALAEVRHDLASSWNTRRLAGILCMSPRSLQRRFVARYGVPFNSWLLMERIAAARELLESTDLSIDAIAQRVGFKGSSLLRRHFSVAVGESPSAYRRRFRREWVAGLAEGESSEED